MKIIMILKKCINNLIAKIKKEKLIAIDENWIIDKKLYKEILKSLYTDKKLYKKILKKFG